MIYIHRDLLSQLFPKYSSVLSDAIKRSLHTDDDYRDIRKLMSLLARMPRVNLRINRHIERLKILVGSSDWAIVPYDDANTDLALDAQRRIKGVFNTALDAFIRGWLYDASLTQIRWMPSSGGLKPVLEKIYHPTEIEHNRNYFLNIAKLGDDNGLLTRDAIEESDRQGYLSYTNPAAVEHGGIMLSLLFYVFMGNLDVQEWAEFTKKIKGIIQAIVGMGATDSDKKLAEDGIRTLAENNYVVTPSTVAFNYEKMVDSLAGKNFEEFKKYIDETIEIAITGTSGLASDRERNAWTVQEKNAQDKAIIGKSMFAEFMDEQLLKNDYYMNVNKSSWDFELPYYFSWKPKLTQDKEANSRIIESMIAQGIPVTYKTIEEMTGVKIEGDPNTTVNKPETQLPFNL